MKMFRLTAVVASLALFCAVSAEGDWFQMGSGGNRQGDGDDEFGDERAYHLRELFDVDGKDFNNSMFHEGSKFFQDNSTSAKWFSYFLAHGGKMNLSHEAHGVASSIHEFVRAQMELNRAAHGLLRDMFRYLHKHVEGSSDLACNRSRNFSRPIDNFAVDFLPADSRDLPAATTNLVAANPPVIASAIKKPSSDAAGSGDQKNTAATNGSQTKTPAGSPSNNANKIPNLWSVDINKIKSTDEAEAIIANYLAKDKQSTCSVTNYLRQYLLPDVTTEGKMIG